jgi:hypothetical protein
VAQIFLADSMPLAESYALELTRTDLRNVMGQFTANRVLDFDCFYHGLLQLLIHI